MSPSGIIREARRDDPEEAARLAELWNVFDAHWPGGGSLLHGVPMTAEHMLEQLRLQELVVVLVAELAGELVGYLGVRRVPGRDDVVHGATVAVRPEWQGKGFGKALLLGVLDRLVEMGYRQYRRTTWSGNLKAIPLYKKIGDFWKPGTSVFLQNFIPTALALPIARDFFARHVWHQSLRRELTLAPDELRWHGIRVFPYHFEAGGDLFVMVIDPQAEAPTSIETNDVCLSSYVGCEEVVCGIPSTLTWEIVNKREDGRPLRVELAAESPADVGIGFAESFEVTDSLRLQRAFVIPPGTGSSRYAVHSRFLIDGVPVALSTGFRTAQPIEIEVQGLQPAPVKPGEEVVVRLYNRLKVDLAGRLAFEAQPGLAIVPGAVPFSVPAASWGSCRFSLTAQEGAHTARVRAIASPAEGTGPEAAAPLEVRSRPVTFRTAPLDRVYAWADEESGEVTVEAPLFWVRIHLRSGAFSVHERLSGLQVLQQGPPALGRAAGNEPDTPPCPFRIETDDGRLRLTLETMPATGVGIARTLTVSAGPFLRLDHRVHNSTGATLEPRLRCPGEILLHRGVTLPLAGGLVHEAVEGLGDFPLPGTADLPGDPAAYGEGWLAREEHGLVAGIVWKACGAIDGTSVRLDLPAIAPGGFADADPLHLVVAQGDWEVVRALWRRLWQPGGAHEERRPTAHPVLSAGFAPGPPLVAGARTRTSLSVRNRRLKPFAGRWALSSQGLRIEPAEGELPEVTPQRPAEQEVTLTCRDLAPRIVPASLLLTSEVLREEREEPVVIVGDGNHVVAVEGGEDGDPYTVDNGWLSFAVAPGHHGALVSLRREGQELLTSSFPQPRPYRWMAAWFGGVEPYLQQPGDVRHVRDIFAGEPAERTGARGLAWRGVRLTCQIRYPGTRWLALSVEYLTLGGSNLVALVQRLTNRSGAPQEVAAGFVVFPATSAETRMHYEVRRPDYRPAGETRERDAVLRQRAPSPANFRFGDARWVAIGPAAGPGIVAADPLLTLISFPAPGEAGGWLDQETAGLHTGAPCRLEPGETRERLAWLAIAGGPAQAQAYQILGTMPELP